MGKLKYSVVGNQRSMQNPDFWQGIVDILNGQLSTLKCSYFFVYILLNNIFKFIIPSDTNLCRNIWIFN